MTSHDLTPTTTLPAHGSGTATVAGPAPVKAAPVWQSSLLGGTAGSALLMLGNQWWHWGLPTGGTLGLTVGLAALWAIREVYLAARYGLHAAEKGADLPYIEHVVQAELLKAGIARPGATAGQDMIALADRLLAHFERQQSAQEAADSANAQRAHEGLMNCIGHSLNALTPLLGDIVARKRQAPAEEPAAQATSAPAAAPDPAEAHPAEPAPAAPAPSPAPEAHA